MKKNKKIDYEKQFTVLSQKTVGLIKSVDYDLTKIRDELNTNNQIQDKWVNQDRAKWESTYRDYRHILKRNFKITDMFCVQVADNKILRARNEFILKELKNYVPEHHLFQDSDASQHSEEDNVEEDTDRQDQLEFDFSKSCFDDTKH